MKVIKNITVLGIIEEYLKKNGYDGLYSPDDECACGIGDLAPCTDIQGECMPGYRGNVCPSWCGEGCDYHIFTSKDVRDKAIADGDIHREDINE